MRFKVNLSFIYGIAIPNARVRKELLTEEAKIFAVCNNNKVKQKGIGK
jgi:hypothetical protein